MDCIYNGLRKLAPRAALAALAALITFGLGTVGSALAQDDDFRSYKSLVEQAKSELACLAPSPARDLLGALADAVVTRRY